MLWLTQIFAGVFMLLHCSLSHSASLPPPIAPRAAQLPLQAIDAAEKFFGGLCPLQEVLDVTQYARKSPFPDKAVKYHITARMYDATPDHSLRGSIRRPLVYHDDSVAFKVSTKEDLHTVTIVTTPVRWKMVDPDNPDLAIYGFPTLGHRLDTSDPHCHVGEWLPDTDPLNLGKNSSLGIRQRKIRCCI